MTAGLSLEDAAPIIGLKKARGESGAARLAGIEASGDVPRPLLLKMTKAYRRPLLVFYLSHPPKTGIGGRTLGPCQARPATIQNSMR